MYRCDKCGGDAGLREKIIDGARVGAVVCRNCGEVYPSYYITPELLSLKDDKDKQRKEHYKLKKKNIKVFGRKEWAE